MGMGVVSDEDFDLEVSKLSDNKSSVITYNDKGRSEGDNNIPDAIRKIASEALLNGAPAKLVCTELSISPASASAYKNGATSTATYDKPNKSLISHNDKIKERINGRASNVMLKALKHITTAKLLDAKPTDLSQIAANMARVIDKTTPKIAEQATNTIIFYSPKQIDSKNFEVIDVSQ
jgi:hypothetical protein